MMMMMMINCFNFANAKNNIREITNMDGYIDGSYTYLYMYCMYVCTYR